MTNTESRAMLPFYLFLLLGLVFFLTYQHVQIDYASFSNLIISNKVVLIFLIIGIVLTISWHFKMIKVYIFKSGQGSKLSDIAKNVNNFDLGSFFHAYFRSLVISIFICLFIFLLRVKLIFLVKYCSVLEVKFFIYCVGVLTSTSILTSIKLYVIRNKKEEKRGKSYKRLPRKNSSQIGLGVIGEDEFSIDELKIKNPKWIYSGKKGLKGNFAIIGGIGRGKTSSLIIPVLKQILSIYKSSTIYIADAKGTLVKHIDPIINASGRKVLRFCPSSTFRFNPIYREDLLRDGNYEKIASMIKYASKNILGSDSKSKFWEKRAYDLVIAGLISCYLTKEYFTFNDLRQELVSFDENTLNKLKIAKSTKELDKGELHNVNMALISIEEFVSMGKDLKSSILASATVFLDLFNDYRVAKIFCPKKEEINLHCFEDIVKDNNIILTYFDSKEVSRGLGTFLKILYTEAVKKVFIDLGDLKKEYFLFADEYQEIVTTSDADITALGREFGLVHLVSFQSFSQLISRLGQRSLADELMNNLQNKICLQVTDEATINHMIMIAGKYQDRRISEGFSENTQRANKNWFDGGYTSNAININQSYTSSTEDKDHLQKKDFTRLKSFEAFAFLTDGINSQFYKLFTKPYFISERMPHRKVLKLVGEGDICLPQI